MAHRRALALITSLALAVGVTGAVPAITSPARAATAAADTAPEAVTLVGDLQSELGCSAEWQPDCAATHLDRVGSSSVYSKTFDVPKGSWQLKVAINNSWDESYGADGAKGGANIPLVLQGNSRLVFSYDAATHRIGITPTDLPGAATSADAAYAKDSLRTGATRERYYFLMADRFANGSAANDTGGLSGTRLQTGFDPSDKGFYHGGDLKGVVNKLDYIKGLGTTAIWLTPSFKNKPVQGSGADASAGYHGYWITDFTQIDPHLGTNADMKALIAAAHAKGMKVYFDIITNHTADVISHGENQYTYRDKSTYPYKDANGNAFDDAAVAEKPGFPAMKPDGTSFPYTPVVSDAEKTVKVPAWLNDPTNYHNRGDSTYAGESTTYGDFSGLDDLFTEKLSVEQGMEDIYKQWVDFGVDGFRIDTVKHVNMEFWQRFAPAMQAEAAKVGNKNFFMFGEVYDSRPSYMSQYTTTGKLPATLDFGFQSAATSWVQGKAGTDLRNLYTDDDYYTDTDSNAYELPTFLGNHDMGRAAMMLKSSSTSKADLLKKVGLADDLMYLSRGNPITYYGDEQGFIGSGGDKDSRQDMFATNTAQYASEDNLTGPSGAKDRYDTTSPLYRRIAALSTLRQNNPALSDGPQVHRYASNGAGIFAFSRIDRAKNTEYVVALNNSTTSLTATFDTYGHNQDFTNLYGGQGTVRSGKDGRVTVTLPPQTAAVWVAKSPMDKPKSAPALYLTAPSAGGVVGGRAPITAAIPDNTFAQVSFLVRPVGTSTWQPIGTDDNAPYRVFHDVSGYAKGTLLEYRAVAKDSADHISASSTYGVAGDPATSGGSTGGVGPVTQPDHVSVPGDLNTAMGCSGDWQPDCANAQLALSAKDQVWKGSWTLPAQSFSYKAAIDNSWDENYGAGAVKGGGNISLTVPSQRTVNFYYDHATHWIADDVNNLIITAPGSFQSALGCGSDWAPDCMRPWLQDPDGDGVYTWSSDQIPAGSYDFKIAVGLSWNENYGDGGAPGGNNMSLTVPSNGTVVTFSYDSRTHVTTTKTSRAGSAPDLTKTKAIWVSPDTIAVPDSMLGGQDAKLVQWQLAWSATGGLAIDAEAVTGGTTAPLTYAGPVSAATVAAHPELKGYLALTVDKKTVKQVPDIIKGQVAVAAFDSTHQLLDATGVQIPYVLDALYSSAATKATYGVSFPGNKPTYRVWAPTAQQVDLLTWPASAADDAPTSAATRTPMKRESDGSWTAATGARNDRYLYDITVYAPSTKKVEHNVVTDPYSTGLTLNSTKSVAVDLADKTFQPAQWVSTPAPKLPKSVDSTIYELHVRDFSIGDTTVPAQHRGTYLAFADDGAGSKHLRSLAKAGMNTVHLLPSFDIATIEEDRTKQATPASAGCPDLKTLPPDSTQQQSCIDSIRSKDGFNWGYDPFHWGVPEGSYATTDAAAGGTRVAQFRTMVGALHKNGLRVVLDQVFNHTPTSGQASTSVLDKIVPGYYQRLDKDGVVYTSTCCQNVATEHAMAQKIMVDTVVRWARDYKVDGFRFDLMGHHTKANMLAVRSAVDALTPAKDGVDGKSIYLYGEGWNFGEVADNALFTQAAQGNLGGTGIGSFNDRMRDAVRGGGPFDDDPRKQGFGSGEFTDPNGAAVNSAAQSSLAHDTDLTMLSLAGNLRTFTFTDSSGKKVNGTQVDYNGAPAAFADQPAETVSYVDAHDNETLFDSLTYKLPVSTSMADRVRMNTLSLATTALSQTPSFWHAGSDLLRSKSLDRNSYDSGDWFNTLSWTGEDNGFGHGLPLKGDNESKWSYMKPLLANAALKPSAADVQHSSALAQDLLKLRFSTPLFRLGSAALIDAKVSFPASGTADAHPGVIAMRIDDTVGGDVDPALKGVVVVFNATPDAVTQKIPGLAGTSMELSPVQASGADPVVKTSTWDASTGSLTVPARTVAVFVQR